MLYSYLHVYRLSISALQTQLVAFRVPISLPLQKKWQPSTPLHTLMHGVFLLHLFEVWVTTTGERVARDTLMSPIALLACRYLTILIQIVPFFLQYVQEAVKSNSKQAFKKYSQIADSNTKECMLRGLVDFRPSPTGPIPIDEVEETKYPQINNCTIWWAFDTS